MKQCNRCKNWLDESQFHVKGWKKDGNRGFACKCRVCTAIHRGGIKRTKEAKRLEAVGLTV